MNYATHILAFGAHPDDVEIGAGGILYKTAQQGKRNIIIDLTPSQKSTAGTPEIRIQESQQAADILGITKRENLGLQDTELLDTIDNRNILANKIIEYRPEIILIPSMNDRHPDHEATALLIKNAIFYAGLKNRNDGASHKPRMLLHYMIRNEEDPDIIIALNQATYDKKMESFQAYVSQSPTNSWGLNYIHARHMQHGHRIGKQYGEGFNLYSHGVGVEDFDGIMTGFF